MHEISLCKQMLKIISEQAKADHFSKVKTVRLKLGALVCVEKAALKFAFDAISVGTVAEAAQLEFIDIPVQARCNACNKVVVVKDFVDPCKYCGSHQLTILSGQEFIIDQLEIE